MGWENIREERSVLSSCESRIWRPWCGRLALLLLAAILLVQTDPKCSPPNSSPSDSYVGWRRWELWVEGLGGMAGRSEESQSLVAFLLLHGIIYLISLVFLWEVPCLAWKGWDSAWGWEGVNRGRREFWGWMGSEFDLLKLAVEEGMHRTLVLAWLVSQWEAAQRIRVDSWCLFFKKNFSDGKPQTKQIPFLKRGKS